MIIIHSENLLDSTQTDTSIPILFKHQTKHNFDYTRVFRYEDFSMDPYNNTREVFKFFGFTMHSRVSNFLDTHTKANIGGVSSTFRDSKTAPFKWRERLNEDEVYTIQDKCAEAMALWGYKSLTEKEDLKTFEPVYNLEHFTLGN